MRQGEDRRAAANRSKKQALAADYPMTPVIVVEEDVDFSTVAYESGSGNERI